MLSSLFIYSVHQYLRCLWCLWCLVYLNYHLINILYPLPDPYTLLFTPHFTHSLYWITRADLIYITKNYSTVSTFSFKKIIIFIITINSFFQYLISIINFISILVIPFLVIITPFIISSHFFTIVQTMKVFFMNHSSKFY